MAAGIWVGFINPDGYGTITLRGRALSAHRLSYAVFVGPIGALTLDHLCRNRACVNPKHLEPVTSVENIQRRRPDFRGEACPRGHTFVPLIKASTGHSQGCRECRMEESRARNVRWRARRRGQAAA
jgi:HNH endonuclease